MDLDATIKGANVSLTDVETIISNIIAIPIDDGVSFYIKRISEIMEKTDYPGVRVSMETKETEHMLENSRAKRKKKNLDMIAANNLKQQGAGFAGDTNVLTLITEDWEKELALMSKDEAAKCLLDELLKIKKNKK